MFQQGDNSNNRKRKQSSTPTNQSFFRNVADSLVNIVPRSIAEWFRPSALKQQPDDSTVEQTTERILLPPPKKKRCYESPTQALLEPTYYGETTSYYSATDEGFNVTRGRPLKRDEILNRVERWVQEPSSTMGNYSKFHQESGSMKCIEGSGKKSRKRAFDSRDEAVTGPLPNLENKSGENEEPGAVQNEYKNKLDKWKHGHKTTEDNDLSSHEMSKTRSLKNRCLKSNLVREESNMLRTAQKESPKAKDEANMCISPRKSLHERCAEILTPQPNVHSISWKRLQSQNNSCGAKVQETKDKDSIDWSKGLSICSGISDEPKAKKSYYGPNLTSTSDIVRSICGEIEVPSHLKRADFNVTSASRNPHKSYTNSSFKTQSIQVLKQAAIITMKAKSKINREETTVPGTKTSNSTQDCSSNALHENREPLSEKSDKDTKCDSSLGKDIQIESPGVTHTDTQKNMESRSFVSISTQTSLTVKRKIEKKSPLQHDKNKSKIKLADKLLNTNLDEPKCDAKNTPATASDEAPKTLELEKQIIGNEAHDVVNNQKDLAKVTKESDMKNNEDVNEKDEIPPCNSQKDKDKILAEKEITNKPTDKWECTICLVKNDDNLSKCACCEASKPGGCKETVSKGFNFGVNKGNAFKKIVKTQGNIRWECKICTVKNDNNLSKCACCEEPKPGECKETGIVFNFGAKSDNIFNKIVNTQADKWECTICLVKNDNSLSKCACCEAPKPGGCKETGSNSFNFGIKSDDAFKKIVNLQAEKWECTNCLVKNDKSLLKCDCCEAPKPGGCNETGSDSVKFGVKSDDAFKKIVNTQADKWKCTTCLVNNDTNLIKCACCEAPKPDGSKETISNSFNFGLKGNTFNFEIPKVNFKFGIPKEAKDQPVNDTLQENIIKKQDTPSIVTENLQVPTVKTVKTDESNNMKEFTPFITTNFFSPPITTAASVPPLISTNTSVLQSISTDADSNFTLKQSESANLIQTPTHSASNPFAMNNNPTHPPEQASERNIFCNPSTNSVPATENIHTKTTKSNSNTMFPNFCFTTTNSANTSSVLPFTNNNASSGSFKEQTNAINSNATGKGITFSSAPPALAAGCFGAGPQDQIPPISKSSTNAVQNSPFTFGIPLNTNTGNENVFGLKTTNIFAATQKSDSQTSIFASPVNPKPDIFGNLQSNNSPITSVPLFGNSNISDVTPMNNSSSPFISSNQISTNVFGGSQSSSTPVGNIFGNSPSTHQTPAMSVFGNTNNNTPGNQPINIFSTPQPVGNQLPIPSGNIFGNANMPAAITTINNPPTMFSTPKQQTPIIFGSPPPSNGGQGSAVAMFGNTNTQPQTGNVFNPLGNPAPAFETPQASGPIGNSSIFNFGPKQSTQQQPNLYNFVANNCAPKFNMGSSPIPNTAGRRVRKAVRRNCQR